MSPVETEDPFDMGGMDLDGNFGTAGSSQGTVVLTPGPQAYRRRFILGTGRSSRALEPQDDVLGWGVLLRQVRQLGYQQGSRACGPMLQKARASRRVSSE